MSNNPSFPPSGNVPASGGRQFGSHPQPGTQSGWQPSDPSQAPSYPPHAPSYGAPNSGFAQSSGFQQPQAPGNFGPGGYGPGGPGGYGPGGPGGYGPGGPIRPTPWYKKPLTWIIAALVLIAAIVAVVFLVLKDDDNETASPSDPETHVTEPATDDPEPSSDDPDPTDDPEPSSDDPDPTDDPSGGDTVNTPNDLENAKSVTTSDKVESGGYTYEIHGLTTRKDLLGDDVLCAEMTVTDVDAMFSYASPNLRMITPDGEEPTMAFPDVNDSEDLSVLVFEDGESQRSGVYCFRTQPDSGTYKIVYDVLESATANWVSYVWELDY